MKYLIYLILFLLLTSPVYGDVITGGVEYDVNSARNEIYNNPLLLPDRSSTISHFTDIHHCENYNYLLQGKTNLTDRTLAKFSDSSYAVIYKKSPFEVFYYSEDGILTHHEIKSSLEFPNKAYKYNTNSKLITTTLNVSETEAYIYKPDGTLIAHWLGSKCFDKDGNVVRTREIYK